MDTVIRDATAADAAAIAGIHVRAWQSAYRGMVDDMLLDGLSVAERTSDWTVRLRSTRSQGAIPFTLVGERDGEPLGFCNVARLDEDAQATIGALYVEPEHLRTGLGGSLLQAALDRLYGAGTDDVVLWVLEANDSARAFYERFGFRDDGSRDRAMDASEIRMRTSLACSGSPFAKPTQEL
jgi:RimJ/RimL family protein N-acetyltransferase